MSVWTHVAGIVRIDGLAGVTPIPDIGYTCDFDDDEETWDRCNVPCGSEGSLHVDLWINPDAHALARFVIHVFGDLRDFDDEAEIVAYFDRLTDGQMVRQGCFTVDIEGQGQSTYTYTENGWTS